MNLDHLLEEAAKRSASDVHITVGIPPKCRISGELVGLGEAPLAREDVQGLIFPLLTEEARRILEKNGEVDFAHSLEGVGRFRINVFKQRGDYAMAVRIFRSHIPTMEELGIPDAVHGLLKKRRGMVIVGGQAGSGKSTTLAALLHAVNQSQNVHVITLEDPIEYLFDHHQAIVNQREVGIDTISYANGLKAALREDPDMIFVGDAQDTETMETAITAAETGHLVFCTMHTLGIVQTVERMVDMFPQSQRQQVRLQISHILEGVLSQQLLPDIAEKNRVAAYEIIRVNNDIRSLIRESRTELIPAYIESHKVSWMKSMDEAIHDLYLRKKISKNTMQNYLGNTAAGRKDL